MDVENKIKLVLSNDITTSAEHVIFDIKKTYLDFNQEHIIIVPDKYSLITEKMVFSVLGNDSLFNVRVMGINRFVTYVLKEQNWNKKILSGVGELVALGSAVIETSQNFEHFPKRIFDFGFVQEIKNTITQLKTSGINYEKLGQISEKNAKIHDLKLIYENYESIQKKDAVDTADFLNEFLYNCNSKLIANSKFYFVFFDSMTKQGVDILSVITKFSLGVEIGLCCGMDGQKNKFIYDSKLKSSIISLAEKEGIVCDVENVTSANHISDLIARNLFIANPQKTTIENFAGFYECFDNRSEIEMIAKKIRAGVESGKRYRDYAIAVSSLESKKDLFKHIFDEFEIPVHIDDSICLSNTSVYKFLKHILDYNIEPDLANLKKVVNSPFVDFTANKNEIINFINRYVEFDNIFKTSVLEEEIPLQKELFELNKKVVFENNHDGVEGMSFCQFLKDMVCSFKVEEKVKQISDTYRENKDLENQKLYECLFKKITELLDNFEQCVATHSYSFSSLYLLFGYVADNVEINTLPMRVDDVFVGDISSSFFESGKTMFVAGANANIMPDFKKDVGILSDKDIKALAKYIDIEPTIKIINLRKRLKLCSVLSLAKEKLYVSWQAFDQEGKISPRSVFVDSLRKIFCGEKEIAQISKVGFGDGLVLNYFASQKDACENLSTYRHAKRILYNYIGNDKKIAKKDINSLFFALKSQNKKIEQEIFDATNKNKTPSLNNSKEIFFKNGTTSISKIETYSKCPFMFFAEYGLKLQSQPPLSFDASVIGSVEHFVFEKFFASYKLDMNDDEIKAKVEDIFNIIKQDKKYSTLFDEHQNQPLIKSLKKETSQMISSILNQQKNSDFKIFACEKFVDKNSGLNYQIDGEKIALVGKVDRIDKMNDKLVIIDYKTGNVEHKKEDIYYGDKIQVFVYAKALEKSMKSHVVGTLYLPVSKRKTKDKKSTMFAGVFENDMGTLFSFDKKLQKDMTSSILKAKLIKNKKQELDFDRRKSSAIASKEEFDNFKEYSSSILKHNLSLIAKGFIKPSPLVESGKSPCDYCEHKGICRYDSMEDGAERKKRGIAALPKIEAKNENE